LYLLLSRIVIDVLPLPRPRADFPHPAPSCRLQKLHTRLKEKHDPQLTSIMRTLDDNVIFNFIETYKGCTMSIDAILVHIGANVKLTSSSTDPVMLELAAPAPSTKKVSDANGYRLVPRESVSKGAGFRQIKTAKQKHEQGERGGSAGGGEQVRPTSPSEHSVGVLHRHMSAERLLPSMQPEKVTRSELLLQLLTLQLLATTAVCLCM
jgi:hypothetical protein